MNKFLLIVVFACLLFPLISSAEIPKETIQKLLEEKQFDKLDSIAEDIRKNRKVLDDGWTELGFFYKNLVDDYGSEKEIVRLINVFEEWEKAYPKSPTPLVALSKLYRSYAWAARGSGWASSVSKEKWDLVYERTKKAYEYVNNEIAEKDIRSYLEKIENIRVLGGTDVKKKAYEVLDKSISIDPDYDPPYAAMANLLLERWYGDNRYEMINFVKKYSEKRKGIGGSILYISTLLSISSNFEPINYLNDMGVPWPEMEQKIKSVLNSQPDNKFILNAYWYFAGMALDFDRAEELRRKLDKTNGWITNPWWDSRYKTRNAIKALLTRRDEIAVFTLNATSIANASNVLVAYCEFFDAAGDKIKGIDSERETFISDDIKSNFAEGKIVRHVKIPTDLLRGKVTVKYTIENLNTGDKVVDSKSFAFGLRAKGMEEVSGLWGENLLNNSSGENGTAGWHLYGKGGTIKADELGRPGDIFYTEDFGGVQSNLNQEIAVPREFHNAYIAVAGYLSINEAFTEPNSNKPYLSGYFIHKGNYIISNLRADAMQYDCQSKCWQPRWGIFKIPSTTEMIIIHMNHFVKAGEASSSNTRFYYDDLELRAFKTLQEAEEFIDLYKKTHQQILLKTLP